MTPRDTSLLEETFMKPRFGGGRFYGSVLCALVALLFTGTFARAQHLFQLDWGMTFNNAPTNDSEDNWVANSFPINLADRTHVVSVTLPIGDTFANQPISALIYQGFDLQDPTSGGG